MALNDQFCAPDECAHILASILAKSDDAVIRTDLDGVIVGWSAGASRLYGYTAAEAVGASVGLLIPEEKWDEFVRLLDGIRAGGAVNHRETVRRAKDGRLLDVALSILPVTDEAHRTVSALSIARDVTGLKQAEAACRAADARWRAIIDSAADGIIVVDAKGTIESFNAAAERLFGYCAADVIGHSVNLLMPSPYREEHDSYLANYLAGAPAKIIGIGREVTARRHNGDDFPARLAVGEASVDGETRFTGIVHDLTDRVQMEKRLGEQTALAKLGEMAAVVAHEFRNALAGVRGAVQVVGGRLPAGSREASAIGEIVARIDALTKIVNDMLLFAHLPEPRLGAVDIAELVASVVTLADNDLTFRQIRVEVIGSASTIVADADLLRVVLLNLFTNSAQAMDGVGTIRVMMETTPTSCQLLIADEGPGVPPAVRERLFTPFFTTKARGSGLGLATARRIVEAHRGSLRIECPSAGGTTAIVQLPVERA
jgi:two-component system sensor kinase FixL